MNPASWLPLAAGASSHNPAFAFSCISVPGTPSRRSTLFAIKPVLHCACESGGKWKRESATRSAAEDDKDDGDHDSDDDDGLITGEA